ncbi:cytidylate kinase family protein [Ruminiclostridium cellobioparum]|uniref:Na+-driven multidrug efflux pump n=1 Tax=Ruminiclostridium cellobioparum subsp. termitidis CT1112 TaxID=1195236 RepID=S0FK01_RUMCE|nr:cytidylate kinase family protein [Ruminiclostridium cellobioparum]EMS72510.1 Na+-driven multidrug efflux pump [Ruminiclostridium cellobioparum subsp. termitidis CT1112]
MLNHLTDYKQLNKQFVKYVIPSIIGMLVQALYIILDGVIVGQGIGEVALGAVNVVFPFSMIVIALSMLIGVGGANVYSFHKGQDEIKKANNIFCQCLTVSVILGAVLALIGFFFRESLSILLGANEDLLPYATAYMKWSAPFSMIQIVAFVLSVFVRNDEDPKIAMLGSIFGAVINAILDVIFILVLHYGIEVAAITNGIGVSIEFVFYISHFIRKKGMLRIRKPVFHFSEIKRVVSNGVSSALMEFSVPAVTLSFNIAVVRAAGTVGVSAYAIVCYVTSIISMVVLGVTQGTQPLMSFYHGKGEKKTFSHVYSLGKRTNIVASILLAGICILFGREMVPLFQSGSSVELTELTAYILRQYSVAYIFVGLALMNILFFQTTERNRYATLISFLRCMGFTQVFILLSVFAFDAKWLYLAYFAGELCHYFISQLLVRRTMKGIEVGTEETQAVIESACVNTGCVITISREYGSGGRIIGRRVAQALNIPFYDREIIGLAAEQAQLSVGAVEQSDQKMEKGFEYGLYIGRKYMPIPDQVFIAQSKVIKEIADKGACVIVGRCADHILQGKENCIHIFIHAPFKQRVRRAMGEYGLKAKDAEQAVQNNDVARESYYNHYTGAKWGDAHYYHLSINSSMGIEQCVELMLHTEKIKGKYSKKRA